MNIIRNSLIKILFVCVMFGQYADARENCINYCNKMSENVPKFSKIKENSVFNNIYKGVNMLEVSNVGNKQINVQNSTAKELPAAYKNIKVEAKENYSQVPLETIQAYNNVIFSADKAHLKVDYIPPKSSKINIAEQSGAFKKAQQKLAENVNNEKYFWVNLPEKLINEKYTDYVYTQIKGFQAPDSKLIFVALGNPANTDEMAKALGLSANLTTCCDITPAQIKNTIKKAGGNLEKIQVIISSKSGSTFESNQTYKLLTDEFTNFYAQKGLSKDEIQNKISKHLLFITDKSPDKSKLKKQADELGIKTIDCVEGHSAFADLAYSIPVLAYLGLPKESADKMINSADKMSKKLLKESNLEKNEAGKIAAFDKCTGAKKEQFIFHDSAFSDFSSTTKQVYNESLRKLNLETNVYPRAAHSGLESSISTSIDDQQVNNITNVVTRINYTPSEKEKAYLKEAAKLEEAHILNAQQEGHFQKKITLELGKDGITPESLGEFEALKSFTTYYKNEIEDSGKNDLYNQDYVKGYKKIRESFQ